MPSGASMPNSPRFRIQWLRIALKDLGAIGKYLQREAGTEIAEGVVATLWEHAQSLRTTPERARPGRVPDTRELVLTDYPYFIAFRVRKNAVQILRVLHTSRQYPSSTEKSD
ncbi:putative toxin Y4kP [uncultured delta proteobacterium]|uniref:Putative toxin Y4kP n=1 Tax=uncultured delta proteobacterium TaxID=34034 RepID=A0A212KFH4_9DELT|nr:putative toxin Y4kP [uncultured delta proteobacterium]